ncbi:hypothetical protein PHYBLDRAFT_171464 [Phycomyces blakesleeanus NRRL 1555(-)]|uniref:Uncharacterized protein n=1 Tax=Phycomyces blakesleeanus (strain ATCC 8743b / DSM 1359 / FGSC 10004 / NBRC 33097 / NRRL 1555) TaxID=763407 RepID=A0A167LBL5_PHYB8|nr:hypothetical protein PHYBLDRAFT_171464 [Phycomyces blakesleeanus NRRL 1555(-)]OAD70069.1 hypothetical protein PHYBLDRAFT_171464 [Phycomyces blakesleeanus NRRL 1555(-)]|eukprot:XP_018288109.1 hypothetical protein PHYBLDRAFT_171464 [Phycomyces blakesleeanus NRRL 1555(-)]
MLHEKLEEYNSAFEKIMEGPEEPEMPEDPKSSATSTTDETPKKSRGQYQKPTDKDIKKLLYLYFIRGLTIEKASKIKSHYTAVNAQEDATVHKEILQLTIFRFYGFIKIMSNSSQSG